MLLRANNRYYNSAYGRFMTPDPYRASGSPSDPQTWNRYAYTGGDPVNRKDPSGLLDYPGYESCVANDYASGIFGACPINDDDAGDIFGFQGNCDPSVA